jgi:hypothetical protein
MEAAGSGGVHQVVPVLGIANRLLYLALRGIYVMLLMAWAGSAAAVNIDTGIPSLKLRWDNTLRYNLGAAPSGLTSAF